MTSNSLPPRFFVGENQATRTNIQLDKSDIPHAAALRLRPNEQLDIVIGSTTIRRITLSKIEKAVLHFTTFEDRPIPEAISPKITLVQALPKGDKLADIINHCCQLGLHKLILWQSERSISTPSDQKWPSKLLRLEQIARGAAMQSKQDRILEIEPKLFSTEKVSQLNSPHKIVLWEEEHGLTLKHAITHMQSPPNELVIVVGPEGGISAKEIETLRSGGFTSASLGPSILRVEIAAFSAVSGIRFFLSH